MSSNKSKQQPPAALRRDCSHGRNLRNAGRMAALIRVIKESDAPDQAVAPGPFIEGDTAWNVLKKIAGSFE